MQVKVNSIASKAFLGQKREVGKAAGWGAANAGGVTVDGVLLSQAVASGPTPMAIPWLLAWFVHGAAQTLFVRPKWDKKVADIGRSGREGLWRETLRGAVEQRFLDPAEAHALSANVEKVSSGWKHYVPWIALDVLTMASSAVGALIFAGPALAGALAAGVGLSLWQGLRAIKRVTPLDKSHLEASVKVHKRIFEALEGMDLFRRMGRTDLAIERVRSAVRGEATADESATRPRLRMGRRTGFIEHAFNAAVFLWAVTTGNPLMAMGAFILARQAFTAANRFPHNVQELSPTLQALRKLDDFLERPPKIVERENAVELPRRLTRGVDFENVAFEYSPESPLLRKVSFTAKAGEVTVILARNAQGKSTILSELLQRKSDVQRGAIKFDGVDIRDVKLVSLDESVGRAVKQRDQVLDGTVRENLLLAKPHATTREMSKAVQQTGLDDCFPRSTKSVPHSPGVPSSSLLDKRVTMDSVSGGTAQRIALARTILNPPAVALLDEPTFQIDPPSRQRVLKSVLHELRQAGSTVIMTTQEEAAVRLADKVVLIEDGFVVEEGRPEELFCRDSALNRFFNRDPDSWKFASDGESFGAARTRPDPFIATSGCRGFYPSTVETTDGRSTPPLERELVVSRG